MESSTRSHEHNPVQTYLQLIGKYALLDHQQEQQISREFLAGRNAWEELNSPQRPESPGEVQALEDQFLKGLEARELFICSNLRLVVSIAKKYRDTTSSLELIDLIQEGNLGLEHAVEKFDPNKGFKFSTYASYWIKKDLRRARFKKRNLIPLPEYLGQEIISAQSAGIPLTKEQEKALNTVNTVSYDNESASSASTSDTNPNLLEFFADPNSDFEIGIFEDAQVLTYIMEAAKLTEREKSVLSESYGLGGVPERTPNQIGKVHNLTPQRIRQIKKKALTKLQDAARSLTVDA